MVDRIIRILGVLQLLVIAAACATLTSVDHTPYQQTAYHANMMQEINGLQPTPDEGDTIKAGWAKVNLSPPFPTPMAISVKRDGKPYEMIEDSIWVRAFVFDNGKDKLAWVTADLLIIPPEVMKRLPQDLAKVGFDLDQVYLTATHTHSSIGGWQPGYIGHIFAGDYDTAVVNHISARIAETIGKAAGDLDKAQIGFKAIDSKWLVKNRLVGDKGTKDPWLRVVKVQRDDGRMGLMMSFSAHATCIAEDFMRVHRDYPGMVVDYLEKLNSIDMAAFSAGAVGSMGPVFDHLGHWMQMEQTASDLINNVQQNVSRIPLSYQTKLRLVRMPLLLRDPSYRVAADVRVRPWLFYKLMGQYDIDVAFLQVGNIVFAGMPCDFSGELVAPLDSTAQADNLHLIVNSFNGGYIGYITADQWYNLDAYETRTMNWYGPQNGAYFQEIIKRSLERF